MPLLPSKFERLLDTKVFTQRGADVPMVKSLYRKIFPTLCKKGTVMVVRGWGERELLQFLPVMRKMNNLKVPYEKDKGT